MLFLVLFLESFREHLDDGVSDAFYLPAVKSGIHDRIHEQNAVSNVESCFETVVVARFHCDQHNVCYKIWRVKQHHYDNQVDNSANRGLVFSNVGHFGCVLALLSCRLPYIHPYFRLVSVN